MDFPNRLFHRNPVGCDHGWPALCPWLWSHGCYHNDWSSYRSTIRSEYLANFVGRAHRSHTGPSQHPGGIHRLAERGSRTRRGYSRPRQLQRPRHLSGYAGWNQRYDNYDSIRLGKRDVLADSWRSKWKPKHLDHDVSDVDLSGFSAGLRRDADRHDLRDLGRSRRTSTGSGDLDHDPDRWRLLRDHHSHAWRRYWAMSNLLAVANNIYRQRHALQDFHIHTIVCRCGYIHVHKFWWSKQSFTRDLHGNRRVSARYVFGNSRNTNPISFV